MLLSELYKDEIAVILEETNQVWLEQGQLDEGVWDSMKDGYTKLTNTFSKLSSEANRRGSFNDQTLRSIYYEELKKVRPQVEKLNPKVKQILTDLLKKHGISFTSGVDLSRKHLNRIMILKVLRLILFAMSQMKDNGVEWILTAFVSAGIGTVFSALMNAKDIKEVAVELRDSARQIKTLIDKANS